MNTELAGSEREKLCQIITEIQKNIMNSNVRFTISQKDEHSRLDILKDLIISEFSDMNTLLNLVRKKMEVLKSTDKTFALILKQSPSGGVPRKIEDKDVASELLIHTETISELRVLVKAIYEWLYHLQELIEEYHKIQPLVSERLLSQLDSHCEFRHKMVTHKTGISFPLGGMARFHAAKYNFELLMTYPSPSEEVIMELDSLFTKCKTDLEPAETEEESFHERCGILYRNLDKFGKNRRKKVVSFIQKYGTISAQPLALAVFIEELANEIIPRLEEHNN